MKRKITHNEEVEFIGFGYRIGAAFLDNLFFSLIIGPLIAVWYFFDFFNFDNFTDLIIENIVVKILMVFTITIAFWYYIQATPGKRLVNSQIVDFKTGQPASLWRLIVRYLGYFISTITFLFGFIWIAFDKNKRGFHDYLAGTVVIADENIRQLNQQEREYYKPCIKPTPASWSIS